LTVWRLALVALLLLPFAVEAKNRRPLGGYRTESSLVVRNHTIHGGKEVAAGVEAFNAKAPPRVPELVFEQGDWLDCHEVAPEPRVIPVCHDRDIDPDIARADYRVRNGRISGGIIRFGWNLPVHRGTMCHELMHVIANAPHDGFRRDGTSCVAGMILDDPGPWDVAFLRRAYAKRKHR
jgi:hypothetical protein